MASITDNLGRTISAGIDQSDLLKQLADSLRQGVGEPTKWKGAREKDGVEKVADLVKSLPDNLYDKFSDDLDDVKDYIKTIADHYKARKEKKPDARQGRPDVADAIVKLGQSLTKGLSAASHTHLSGIAAGVSALVAAVGTLNAHAGVIATGITSLEKHATKKGSLYVHDIHVQALLSDIQKENRVLLGEIAGVLLEAGGKNRDAIDKVQAAPQVVGPDFVEAVSKMGPVKVPAEFDGSPSSTTTTKAADGLPDQMGEGVKKRFDGTQNTNEVLENLVKLLRKETGYHAVNEHLLESSAATIRRTLKDLRTTGQLNDKMLAQTANLLNGREELSKEANKEIDLLLKQLAIGNKVGDSLVKLSQLAEKYKDQLHGIRNVWDDIRADAINHSRHLAHITVAGLHAGYELSSVTKGIWGEQVKHNTALRAGLFETMNMTAEADHLREAYMKAGREASAVAESGQDMMTFQATYRKNLRAGVKDLNTLNRLTRTGLNLGTMIGANAEATADTFRQWHQTTGMTTNQMAQLNRSIQHAGVATGVVGDELLQAVQAAKELADNMRDAGTLTAEAAGRFIQMSAAAKKMGSEKSVLPILKALSGTDELYNHTDPAQQALLFRSAARTGQLEQLREGTVANDPAAMKKLVGGMKDEFNSYLKQFGVTVDTMHKLTEAQKAQINLQKPFGLKAGEIKRFFDTVEEGTLTFEDRLKSINKQLEGNLTQQERTALLDQKRSLTLQKSLSDLTKFDEASKGTSSMDEALKKAGMTPTTLAANLSDAVKSVNADLVKQGLGKDQIDVNRLSGAMNDPARVSKLIEDIGTAQQKAAVAHKAATDPVAQATLTTAKLNATIASNTGAMASSLLALVGSNGVIAASVASMALNSSAGQNLLTQGLAEGFDFINGKMGRRAAAVTDTAKKAATGMPSKMGMGDLSYDKHGKPMPAGKPMPGPKMGFGASAAAATSAAPAATSAATSVAAPAARAATAGGGGIFSKLLGFLGKILSVGKFVVRFLGPIGAAIGIVMTVIDVLGMLGVNLSDITGIFTDFGGTLKSIGNFILNLRVMVFNGIMKLGKWVVEGLKYVFLELPGMIFDWVIDALKGLAANEWIGPFFEPFVELFTTIKGIVVDALSPLQEIYDAFKDVFSVLDTGSSELSIFSQVMDFLKQTIRNSTAVLGWLIRTGLEPMVQVYKVLGKVVKWSLESFVKPLKALAKWIGGIVKFWKGVFTLDFKKMGEGISDIFSGFLGFLWESIMRVPKMLWKAFTGLFGEGTSGIWSLALSAFKTVFVDFPVWLFQQIKDGLIGLKDWLIQLLPWPLRPNSPDTPDKKPGWKDAAIGGALGIVSPVGGLAYGMGMLSDGADIIRQTGPRIIHEGEMVVPAQVAEQWRAAAMTDRSFTLDKVLSPGRQMGALPKFLSSLLPESLFGSVVPASQRAASAAQGMLGGMAVNADPVASATAPQPVPMGMETAETQIEQRLASAAAPPAVNAANRVLTEIERNTRDTAEGVRSMNTTMRQVLAVLSGGGSGGTSGDGDTATREMPGSTPIWPRLMTNYNGGARKRFLQVGL